MSISDDLGMSVLEEAGVCKMRVLYRSIDVNRELKVNVQEAQFTEGSSFIPFRFCMLELNSFLF